MSVFRLYLCLYELNLLKSFGSEIDMLFFCVVIVVVKVFMVFFLMELFVCVRNGRIFIGDGIVFESSYNI